MRLLDRVDPVSWNRKYSLVQRQMSLNGSPVYEGNDVD